VLRDRHLARGRALCAMISRRPDGQRDLAARARAPGQDGPHGRPAFLVALARPVRLPASSRAMPGGQHAGHLPDQVHDDPAQIS
jgi:hypothetical protein